MAFVNRYSSQPTLAQETQIEGVNVVNEGVPSVVREAAEGIVLIVGEAMKGPYNVPTETEPNSETDFVANFGGYSPYLGIAKGYTSPGGVNGNMYVAAFEKTYDANVFVRVDLRCVWGGTTPFVLLGTITGATASTTYTLAAGTRISATDSGSGTAVVMLDNDYTFTTDSSGDATVNCNVSAVTADLMPGTTAAHIAASATWTIVDTQLLPGNITTSLLVFTNAGSAPNSTCFGAPSILTQYGNAIATAATTISPGADADIILSAFADPDSSLSAGGVSWTGGAIASLLYAHCVAFRAYGKGRRAIVFGAQGDSPSTAANKVTNLTLANCKGASFMGYAWPWVQQFITAAGAEMTVPPNAWAATAMCAVNPEQNPGEPGIGAVQIIDALESVVNPVEADYITLKNAGIMGFIIDKDTGVEIQSGVTTDTVTTPDQKVARFYDFQADTLSAFAKPYRKKLQTVKHKASFLNALQVYLDGLVSLNDPDLQRIVDYAIDAVSGNNAASQGLNIYRVKVSEQQIPGFDFITFELSVGTEVEIAVSVTSSGNPS